MSDYTPSTPLSESPLPLLGATAVTTTGTSFGSPTPSLSSSVPVGPAGSSGSAGYYQYHGTASTPTNTANYFPHFGSTSSGSSAGSGASGSGAAGPKMAKERHQSSLSMDRAAFLMIRIKRIFQKKKRKGHPEVEPKPKKQKPPMLRARTLPAIIPPAFHIVGAQVLPRNANANCAVNDYELTETLGTGGRSPDLLLTKDGLSSNGVSPRHSVSSNSSTGSTSVGKDAAKDKKTSFAKLTRLLSNNTGHKILTTSSGSFWTKQSNQNAPLCQDGLSDVSCFFWNNKNSSSKMKRTGSVDSLLSQVNGGSSDGAGAAGQETAGNTLVESPPGDPMALPYQKHLLTAKYSSASTKTYKASSMSPGLASKSSTYYLGSMLNSGPTGGGSGLELDGIRNSQHSFYGKPIGTKIPGKRQMSIDINASQLDFGLKKSDRKKFEKLSKFNFDQQALFSAVENENFERTQMIVETTDVDINSTNSDGFTPLDISLMLLNMPLIKYLQACGAREGDAFANRLNRELHLSAILIEAERCVHDLSMSCNRQSANGSSSLSSALLKEKERQLVFWERRLRLLQRLKKGLELLEPPPPPLSVHVEIVGATSLLVHYFPPIRLQDKKNIITKYKIEWSDNLFETICGTVEITNLAARHEFIIDNLEPEHCYNVRIACGNCKGFSDYCYPLMNQSAPSSWRSIDDRKASTFSSAGRVLEIDNLFKQIINSRAAVIENEMKRLSIDTETAPALATSSQTQKRVRKSIKNFFGTANKFQKVMKRGVYFACLIYHEERVLVTNEEVLPIIEIDDSYTTSLQNDFYWLLKISCTWEDAKTFRRDMEKSTSSSLVQFRTRILSAIEQMQSSLGLTDLGKLFYKPLRDSEGTVVFCAIKALADPKMISCLSLRWLPLAKLQKRLQVQQAQALAQQQLALSKEVFSERVSDSGISVGGWDSSPRLIGDILTATLDEMIEYHKACNNQLPRGLYIGYVKLRSSVDMMSVLVAKSHPNILPYAKIRDNPHISKQEWAALKLCLRPGSIANASSGSSSSLIHSNLSTSASQLYLSTLQQQKEIVESGSTTSAFGNYLTTSSPTPASPAPNGNTVGNSNSGKESSSHLSQFFQLACSTMTQNGSRCSSAASTNTNKADLETASTRSISTGTTHRHLSFPEKLSFQQLLKFLQMLSQTAGHFLQSIGITDAEHCDAHRLYSLEVIELGPDVSFILLLPPVDEVCSIFNSADSLIQVPGLIYLPLKIFELIHMNTYQPSFTGRYSRISAMLESDIMVAQQAQREAFSSTEVTTTKARLNQLQEFQTQLDEHCRSMRWIMDVVAFARDRQLAAGIPLFDVQYTLGCVDKELLDEDNDDRLFHIPAISLSTPSEHGPKINVIQSECNSTPSSPPATAPPSSVSMTRRKSRDDSYLEEHHRIQAHFNSVHHHRFHHQYGTCSHQNSANSYGFHSDSLDSHGELDPGLGGGVGDSQASDLHQLEGGHPFERSSAGSSDPPDPEEEEGGGGHTKSSFSLHSVHYISKEARGSLTVDKAALEDMRRCVSASKLIGSCSDSPNFCYYQTPPSGGGKSSGESGSSGEGRQRHPSGSSTNYFFGRDMDMYESEVAQSQQAASIPAEAEATSQLRKSPEMLHASIDSLSDISITCPAGTSTSTHTLGDAATTSCYGGSQLSVNSSQIQLLPFDAPDGQSSNTGTPTPMSSALVYPGNSSVFTENYRPLSRVLMFSTDGLEEDLILEEDEDALLDEERESERALLPPPPQMTYQPPRDIPQLKIWPHEDDDEDENPEDQQQQAEEETEASPVISPSFTDDFVLPTPPERPLDIAIATPRPEGEGTSESTTTITSSSCDTSSLALVSSLSAEAEAEEAQLAVQEDPKQGTSSLSINSPSMPSPSSPCPTVVDRQQNKENLTFLETGHLATSVSAYGSFNSSFFNDNFEDIIPDGSESMQNASHSNTVATDRGSLQNLSPESEKASTKAPVPPSPKPKRRTHRKTIEMIKIVYKPPKRAKSSTLSLNHHYNSHAPFEFSLKKLEKLSRLRRQRKKPTEPSAKMRRRIQNCCPECCGCARGSESESKDGSGSENSLSSETTTEESTTEGHTEPEPELQPTTDTDGDYFHPHHHHNAHSLKYPLDDRAIHRRRTYQHLQEDSARAAARKSARKHPPTRRHITIHIAYECRVVPFGTAIKLKVTNRTLCAEIIETVVRYLHQMERPVFQQETEEIQAKTAEAEDARRLLKRKLKLLKQLHKEKARADPGATETPFVDYEPEVNRAVLSRFSLLAVYASNIKHLNGNFPILNLQSPWNEAKLCLKYTAEEAPLSGDSN